MNLGKVKERLEKETERLQEEIKFYEKEDPYKDLTRSKEVLDDTITEIEEHDRINATLGELEKDLSEVHKALARIEKGTYGVCSNCGKAIGEERLAVLPTASLCSSCQADKKKA